MMTAMVAIPGCGGARSRLRAPVLAEHARRRVAHAAIRDGHDYSA
jgi:hypothetical protein